MADALLLKNVPGLHFVKSRNIHKDALLHVLAKERKHEKQTFLMTLYCS